MKEIRIRFEQIRPISPGTVYPRLENLLIKGDITEDGKLFKISAQGKDRLTRNIPDVLDNSFEFMPMLWKILMKPLPSRDRMNYVPDMIQYHDRVRVGPMNFLDELMVTDDPHSEKDLASVLTKLQSFKERLIQLKQKIQERTKAKLQMIEAKIQKIDEKIQNLQSEKATWTGVSIEDGDKKVE